MSKQRGPLSGKEFDLGVGPERLEYWNEVAKSNLRGRTILDVEYTEDEEFGRALAIRLDDGKIVWPLMDDAGNGPGALQLSVPKKGFEVLPAVV